MARSRNRTERGFYVDTSELNQLARRLRKEAPDVNRKMRRELREAGKMIQAEARDKVKDYPSVVPTVKVHVSFASVYISTGSKAVPLGGLLEAGNKGRKKVLDADLGVAHGTFRHPLFGDWEYPQVQPMHPHVAPAAEKVLPEAQEAIVHALKDSLKEVGFRDM